MKQKILLTLHQGVGDTLVLSSAIRDLHLAHPDKYEVYVYTNHMAIWTGNPLVLHVALLSGLDRSKYLQIDMKNEAIEYSNHRPGHYIGSHHQWLEGALGIKIPATSIRPDLYLNAHEWLRRLDCPEKYWVIFAGSKMDFTIKQWPQDFYQMVVYQNPKIKFVQCGRGKDNPVRLLDTIDLVDKTDLRELIKVINHAQGVLTPVSLGMHLAAALPGRNYQAPLAAEKLSPRFQSGQALKPCVVLAGGREAPHWETYPGHRFLHTVGAMDCCAHGGCYKARVSPLHDGHQHDDLICRKPDSEWHNKFASCMTSISPNQVTAAIESYYKGGILTY